ncbi:TPA: hypothetical protein ACGRG7_002694, partial [Morganella morganii]
MGTLRMNKYRKSPGKTSFVRKSFKLKEITIIKAAVITLFSSLPVLSFSAETDLTVIVDKSDYNTNIYDKELYKIYFPNTVWNSKAGFESNAIFPEVMTIGSQAKLYDSPTSTSRSAAGGSMVIGVKGEAYGFGSTALGTGTYARDGSTAIGATAIANNFSTSIGRFAVAESNGVVLGKNARSTAEADGGIAIGNNSKVTAKNAVAIGMNSVASSDDEVSFGSTSLKRKLTNISAGSSDNDAVNFKQLSNTNEIVAKNTGDIANHATTIATINNSLAAGTLGLVQLSDDGRKVVL